MNPPMRQAIVPPGFQNPPQFVHHNLPTNFVQNVPPVPVQGNFVSPTKVP